ncbi:MAG TPA: 50S ribosomal protein L3 [Nitrososphaeraceae archaeon]
MGHRKYSAPRRGSIAFRPRARAKSLEARMRNFPAERSEGVGFLGFAGFKVGGIEVLTVDDREKTPNFGKHLLNPSTIIAVPPIRIIGIRGYGYVEDVKRAIFDVYGKESVKYLSRKFSAKYSEEQFERVSKVLDSTTEIVALVCIIPHDIGISQKRPFVFEIPVSSQDTKKSYDFLKERLGKEIKVTEVFKPGQYIDVSAITRGKGVEGPITRFGVKRKQHKSRKSVRAVGTLGPISPAVVMYTVPRQGQRGFHQRTEYNKRILLISNPEQDKGKAINPKGGFKHFGTVTSDYIVVRGSIPGVAKRLVKLRQPIRYSNRKIAEPKILEIMTQQ